MVNGNEYFRNFRCYEDSGATLIIFEDATIQTH